VVDGKARSAIETKTLSAQISGEAMEPNSPSGPVSVKGKVLSRYSRSVYIRRE